MAKNAVQKTDAGLARDARMKVAEFRDNVMKSGVMELYLTMALTGVEHFIIDGELVKADKDAPMIPVGERLKIMSTFVGKALPAMKDSEEMEQQNSLLADIKKKLDRGK